MKRTCVNLPVSKERMEAAMKRRGLMAKEISIGIGCNPNYINSMKSRGYMSKTVILCLKAEYGIDYDEIKPIEENTVEENPIEQKETDYQKLYDVITKAVYDGVMNALGEW